MAYHEAKTWEEDIDHSTPCQERTEQFFAAVPGYHSQTLGRLWSFVAGQPLCVSLSHWPTPRKPFLDELLPESQAKLEVFARDLAQWTS